MATATALEPADWVFPALRETGVLVTHVEAGSPAARAGLQESDLIVAFDGKAISDPNELRWLASIAGVNKVTALRVARGDRVFDLQVTLGELTEPELCIRGGSLAARHP